MVCKIVASSGHGTNFIVTDCFNTPIRRPHDSSTIVAAMEPGLGLKLSQLGFQLCLKSIPSSAL